MAKQMIEYTRYAVEQLSTEGALYKQAVQTALLATLQRPDIIEKIQSTEAFFDRLLATKLTQKQKEVFAGNWPNMHVTALSVAALQGRILQTEHTNSSDASRHFAHFAARELTGVIQEDTGQVGDPHYLLYERMANGLCGNKNWKSVDIDPAVVEFAELIRIARTRESLENGILFTYASEVFNTGEYSRNSARTPTWLALNGVPQEQAKDLALYVQVHAGNTELKHSKHAYRAYQSLFGDKPDAVQAEEFTGQLVRYVDNVTATYQALNDLVFGRNA